MHSLSRMLSIASHQQLFIAKYVSCKAHPWSLIFQDIVGHFLPHDLHDLSSLESTPVILPSSVPMRLPLHPRSAPWSHDLGRPWLPLTHVLHAHLATPSASFCFVSCWVTRMPWAVLCPSFRSCQVEPLTCTNYYALPNSHLRAGCQFLRCRIRICMQASNVFATKFLDSPSSRQPIPLMSFPVWLGYSIVKPMFVINLRCWFSFDEPTATQICAADLSHYWHSCEHP